MSRARVRGQRRQRWVAAAVILTAVAGRWVWSETSEAELPAPLASADSVEVAEAASPSEVGPRSAPTRVRELLRRRRAAAVPRIASAAATPAAREQGSGQADYRIQRRGRAAEQKQALDAYLEQHLEGTSLAGMLRATEDTCVERLAQQRVLREARTDASADEWETLRQEMERDRTASLFQSMLDVGLPEEDAIAMMGDARFTRAMAQACPVHPRSRFFPEHDPGRIRVRSAG